MRKIVAAVFVSLDGVMQAPGGPEEDPSSSFAHGGWAFHYFDQSVGETMDELFAQPFDLLLGRRTYDIFAAHWPRAKGEPLSDLFNACTKYVATRSDRAFDWENSVAMRGAAAAQIAELKAGEGPTLLVQGSSDLLQTLIGANLMDEFRLLIFPVVLGSGKRLFGGGAVPAALKLTGTKASPSGVILATYQPAGDIVTGSFALEQDVGQ